MKRRRPFILINIALVLVTLRACGDDSPKAAPIGAGAPNSAPTPTPPPTPAAIYPPAPFGITTNTTFAMVGWGYLDASGTMVDSTRGFQPSLLTDAMVTLRWNAALPTYELMLGTGAAGRLRFENTAAQPTSLILEPPGKDYFKGIGFILQAVPNAMAGPSHMATAYIYPYNSYDVIAHGVFGIATPPGTGFSGPKRFAPNTPDGMVIRIDPAAGKVTGTVAVRESLGAPAVSPLVYTLNEATIAPGATTFDATFPIPNSAETGAVHGRLMGPNGDQLAIAVKGVVADNAGRLLPSWSSAALFQCEACGS